MPRRPFIVKATKKGVTKRQIRRQMVTIQKALKDMTVTKMRRVVTVTSDAFGDIHYRYSCSNPTKAVDGAITYNDWTSFGALYDAFKPNMLKIKFQPKLPNDTSINTGYYPIYSFHDKDAGDAYSVTTVNEALQYDNVRDHNVFRPWKRIVKINTKYQNAIDSRGYQDIASLINLGNLEIIGDGFDTNQEYGVMILTMYVSFRNRR